MKLPWDGLGAFIVWEEIRLEGNVREPYDRTSFDAVWVEAVRKRCYKGSFNFLIFSFFLIIVAPLWH